MVAGTGNEMLLTLSKRSYSSSYMTDGFSVRYFSVFPGSACPDLALPLRGIRGEFDDLDSTSMLGQRPCRWLIKTPSAAVQLFLSNISMPPGGEMIVYDGPSAYVPPLAPPFF